MKTSCQTWAALLGLFVVLSATAVIPEHTVENGAVRLTGVGPDNPIIYDNDWWFDVFDNDYLWAQASLGKANLRGNIVSGDMWDWQKGYHYSFEQSWRDAEKALKLARDSGLKNLSDLTRGGNYRMQQFQAVILRQQFDKLIQETARRRENADYLGAQLNQIPGIQPARLPENSRAVWHLYPFRYDARHFHGLTRDQFLKALNAEGIPCSGGYREQYFDGLTW